VVFQACSIAQLIAPFLSKSSPPSTMDYANVALSEGLDSIELEIYAALSRASKVSRNTL